GLVASPERGRTRVPPSLGSLLVGDAPPVVVVGAHAARIVAKIRVAALSVLRIAPVLPLPLRGTLPPVIARSSPAPRRCGHVPRRAPREERTRRPQGASPARARA